MARSARQERIWSSLQKAIRSRLVRELVEKTSPAVTRDDADHIANLVADDLVDGLLVDLPGENLPTEAPVRGSGFHISASVSSENPDGVRAVLERIIEGRVEVAGGELRVEGEMPGDDARAMNKNLLTALRRVERRTRLRAEWSDGRVVHKFFDYVPKGTRPVD